MIEFSEQAPAQVNEETDTEFVYHPCFGEAGTEKEFFGPEVIEPEISAWRSFPAVETAEEAMLLKGPKPLSRQNEAFLFKRFNYARYRLFRLVRQQLRCFSEAREQSIGLWLDRVAFSRAKLVRANMALVPAMAKRIYNSPVEFSELISEGNMALLRSVNMFDVSRGFKFSTYACRAILKSFQRVCQKASAYHRFFPVEHDPHMEDPNVMGAKDARKRDFAKASLWEVIADNEAGLTELEMRILLERHPLDGTKSRTLREIGEDVGLTCERIRQILLEIFEKLRKALPEEIGGMGQILACVA